MKTETWPGCDDVIYMSGLLLELVREAQRGGIEIAPKQQDELCALARRVKTVIARCLAGAEFKQGEVS